VSDSRFSFEVGGARTTALVYPAPGAAVTLVLAHGAGAPQTHPWMVGMARTLASRGIHVVTFNFLYSEVPAKPGRRPEGLTDSRGKRRAPDKNDVLETTWRSALEAVRSRGDAGSRVFLGGKSMGGRIATQLAAKPDVDVAGLVLLGYPLHPPGQPKKLRTAHLPSVRAPMLFVQGSRDAFGTPEELAPFLEGLAAGTRLFVVEGGDHSLAVPRSRGEDLEATMGRVADAIVAFTA
jgi:predicted alpha/beta-hydrolase family hydrolase